MEGKPVNPVRTPEPNSGDKDVSLQSRRQKQLRIGCQQQSAEKQRNS